MKSSIMIVCRKAQGVALLLGPLLLSAPIENASGESFCGAEMPAGPLEGVPRFVDSDRWLVTASQAGGTGQIGDPVILTYSLVPDGTHVVGSAVVSTGPSDLFAFFDSLQAEKPSFDWQSLLQRAFDRWTPATGITFLREATDDSVNVDMTANPGPPGELGVRGDIRLVGRHMYGPALAGARLPMHGGDLAIDTERGRHDWLRVDDGEYALFINVMVHEIGHSLGLHHIAPLEHTKIMEPTLNTSTLGPLDDDIRGAMRLYGDQNENDDEVADAVPLSVAWTPTIVVNRSIDAGTDEDWYSLDITAPTTLTVTLSPHSEIYQMIEARGQEAIAVDPPYAYVLGDIPDPAASGSRDSHLEIYDVFNPAFTPSARLSRIRVSDSNSYSVVSTGSLVFTRTSVGMSIIDVSDPTHPSIITTVTVSGRYLFAHGQRIYVYGSGATLETIDVSDPGNPIHYEHYITSVIEDVVARGNYVYAATGWGGLRAIDAHDPSDLEEVGILSTGRQTQHVAIDGDILYIGDDDATIRRVRIENDTDLIEELQFSANSAFDAFDAGGGYVFVDDGTLVRRYDGTTGSDSGQGAAQGGVRQIVFDGGNLAFALIRGEGSCGNMPCYQFDRGVRVFNFNQTFAVASLARLDSGDISDLALELYTGDGTTLLASADATGRRGTEFLSQPVGPGSYALRAFASTAEFDEVQRYRLTVNTASFRPPSAAQMVSELRVQPSPTRGQSRVRFQVNAPGRVEIRILDITGRSVWSTQSKVAEVGPVEINWDGWRTDGVRVAAGVYYAQIRAADGTQMVQTFVRLR